MITSLVPDNSRQPSKMSSPAKRKREEEQQDDTGSPANSSTYDEDVQDQQQASPAKIARQQRLEEARPDGDIEDSLEKASQATYTAPPAAAGSSIQQTYPPASTPQPVIDPLTGFTALRCDCDSPARMFQVKKDNHNHGRWFGQCSLGKCAYWRWADEPVVDPLTGFTALRCDCNKRLARMFQVRHSH